jgi:deoxycytidylate deaminase/dephospho-CoA kinase
MAKQPRQAEVSCIIGLTGSFGSGCTYLAEKIFVPKGYRRISLSDILRNIYRDETNSDPAKADRPTLQDFGDEVRKGKGAGFLAVKAIEKIKHLVETDGGVKIVVDSIRNPEEVHVLRGEYPPFFLFGVCADKTVRWERVREVYHDNHGEFDTHDRKDAGEEGKAHGQRVADCFYEADVVVSNNKHVVASGNLVFQELQGLVGEYIGLVEHPLKRKQPTKKEALMAMAYAASQQSSCMKRKVGAVIVDPDGNVVSSGYNEVPKDERPCEAEYGACHRDWASNDFFSTLKKVVPEVGGREEDLRRAFRAKFRILDYCRALHAEETAILNLVRNAVNVPLSTCALYTTTYPCRLCANKIASIGIKRVIYMEPYPDDEAKAILGGAKVNDDLFEGVTSRGYFRVYGEQR